METGVKPPPKTAVQQAADEAFADLKVVTSEIRKVMNALGQGEITEKEYSDAMRFLDHVRSPKMNPNASKEAIDYAVNEQRELNMDYEKQLSTVKKASPK